MLVGMTIPVVFFNLGFLWYFKHIKHRREGERETNIELAASESFKDVHHLDTDEKESTLAYYHRIHGNKWAEIAKHLPRKCCEHRLVLPTELSDGFILEKMSSPLGVLVIFESRPEALVQFRISCALWILVIYTSRLLDAACTSALNLLKKGLLVRGEAKTTSKWRLSRRTIDY
ncbi:delta-1-pyrroline-5-carboxylate synthase-like protein [Tanacetum coccineum]